MKYIKVLLPFFAGWALLLFSNSFASISLVNGIAQLILFGLVVSIPIWKTGRMSFVDIAWPWGVFVIGVMVCLYHEGNSLRAYLIGGAYIFVGARMGLGALVMWRQGELDRELPRYQYQHLRWKKQGLDNVPLAMHIEALLQGFANASFLAIPAFMMAMNPDAEISIFEIIGAIIWVGAYMLESVADVQKIAFMVAMKKAGKKKQVCNVGLWKYSRHPNYFSEWMVWNAFMIAAIPSWYRLLETEGFIVWVLLGVSLVYVSRLFYMVLVYMTGAEPAEYYSVQKRPDYANYQKTTNRFFPGPNRKLVD